MGSRQAGGEAGDPSPKVFNPHFNLIIDWQVVEEGCGLLCNPCFSCGHCDNCCHSLDDEEEMEEEEE